MPSIFTQIIKGEIPCYKIYEDDKTFAFLDIHPETLGHTLVIPKLEVDKIYDLPDEDYQALMATVKKLSQHLEKQLGQRTLWKVIGTDVPHAHVHLTPFDDTWHHGREIPMTEADFKEIQAKLRLTD
ncbi:MAG: HIT domain-containing protein [Candidatus Saccharibacteria bacterium]|nr:HIT domain-containing protein [Candidatus Saccharibacteria bacterium]